MHSRAGTLTLLALAFCASLSGNAIIFGLLDDPNQNYTFTRTDPPTWHDPGASVTVPAGPYPGWLGANIPADRFEFFCLDYLLTANWDTSYQGDLTGVSTPQQIEAAYLADKIYWLGGSSASTNLYQGPISMAVWQIMDPTAGHVPRDPAAQPYVLEAQNAYSNGQISAALYPNTKIFVPNNPSNQEFMTVAEGVPEPGTIALIVGGILLIVAGRIRRPKA